ncbi:hypothetical protein HZH66_007026 [Vespula vulgaris]|uniref:Uncharacterized protein n=1 Tax=Vespula vulgaris TaxID=7454 RepID=A0A834K027_VESVU|nr:hypothetical protein HZH66_007026 [Vespula vulgaris]
MKITTTITTTTATTPTTTTTTITRITATAATAATATTTTTTTMTVTTMTTKISTLPQGRRDRSVLWISTLRFTQVSDGQQQSLRDLGNRNWNALLKIDTYTKSDDTDKHSVKLNDT